MTGIILPVIAIICTNAAYLYKDAMQSINTAYDRTLLASAKALGEELVAEGFGPDATLRSNVPYSALEPFETGSNTRIFYKVSTVNGDTVAGYEAFPTWNGKLPDHGQYAALVDFYDTKFLQQAVRVAVLLQPVSSESGLAMAVIQVAETLELRQRLAHTILTGMLWRQMGEIFVIALVVTVVVRLAIKPVRRISAELENRREDDLAPVSKETTPRELDPLLDATNKFMSRLVEMLNNQKRFVRDAAHQLRTPLAVLTAQVQAALRHDVDAEESLRQIRQTVDRATSLTNQMLSLAQVEQRHDETFDELLDLSEEVTGVAIDLSPLLLAKDIDFELAASSVRVRAQSWMLRELVRNLIHNAIKFTPSKGRILVRVFARDGMAAFSVNDTGPGVDDAMKAIAPAP